MGGTTEGGFRARAFYGTLLLLAGLGLPVTGIANHVYGFDGLTSARHAWMAAHNALAVLFTAAAVGHACANRRALWNHMRSLAVEARMPGREALLAGAVTILALLLAGHGLLVGG